jgi:WD40 repeat protein
VDPESLIPNLPKPSELKPFPSQLCLEYKGHTHRIRSIAASPDGQWLASGSDDGTVRIWEVSTGRCFRRYEFKQAGDVIDVCYTFLISSHLMCYGTDSTMLLCECSVSHGTPTLIYHY